MFASKNEIITWTYEGLRIGAAHFLIIRDKMSNVFYPYWIMPNECPEEAKKLFSSQQEEVVDGISLSHFKLSNRFELDILQQLRCN